MRVTCPSCQTNYNIDDNRIPSGGAKLKCAKCQTLFTAKPAAAGPVPLPGDTAVRAPTGKSTSIPLPGTTPARPPITTSAVAAPTITASAPTIPLPGNGLGRVAKFEEALSAVAVPGASTSKPIQLPGLTAVDEELDFGFGEPDSPPSSAPTLQAPVAAPRVQPPPAPLPELSPTEQDFNFDFDVSEPAAAPIAQATPPQVAAAASAPAPEQTPGPSDELNFELNGTPSEAANAVAATDVFDFADPAPLENAPQSPAAPFSPPAASEPLDEAPVAEEQMSDGVSTGGDVELLSFSDEPQSALTAPAAPAAVPESAASARYRIRRKTGKVFGPFEPSIIAHMLEDGQLTGIEEVSIDGEEWSPIGSVAAFHEVIASLAQNPPTPSAAEELTGRSDADRLKRLYEGRMAAVNVTRRYSLTDALQQRAKLLIAAAAVLVLLAAGMSLGFTRYGPFGLRKLFSTHVSRSSPQFVMLQNARKNFLLDTYKSYREANELAAAVLKVRDYPEARAVWCQSVYYLQRRFSDAHAGDIVKANASLEDIELLGKKDLDYLKAIAGAKLADNRAAQALPLLQEAAARNENAADLELALLVAEAYAAQGQSRLALEALNKAIERNKGSARALHALGKLYQTTNEAEKAAKAYSDALEADGGHLSSAIELAGVELLSRGNPARALQLLDVPLSDKGARTLGPTELGRARALKGAALQAQSKEREAIAELDQAIKLDPTSLFAKERLATLLLSQREFAKALPFYKEVVDKDPQSLEGTEGYLAALIGAAKMDDALKAVAAANARFPGKARIAYLDGRVNDALDNAAEAEKHYKRALNADPKLVDAALHLSWLYLRARRAADAKAQLEQALTHAPSDARVRAAIGELALLQSDLPRAREELHQAAELDAKLPEAHLGLAKLAIEDGALDTAKAEVEKALELNPHLKEARYQHGVVLWRAKQLDESLAELEKAKVEDPKSVRVTIALGAVLLEKGDLPRAESTILSALTLDPINAEGHFYLGKVKDRRGEYTQAIDSMRNALDRAPQRADYHYEMGLIYRDAKKMTEAIQEWKKAVELDPVQADSLEALGQAYFDRGEIDQAIDAFDQTLRIDARRTRVLAQIGDCFFQAAKWDRAIAAYQAALRADGSLTQVFYKLGRAYTERGLHASAIEWYRKATAAEPDKPMPYYYLGFAFKEKHRKKEAVEAFRSYLALRTDAEDKKEIEDEIYDLQHD